MAAYAVNLMNQLIAQYSSYWVSTQMIAKYQAVYGGRMQDIVNAAEQKQLVKYNGLYTLRKYADMENQIVSDIFRLQYVAKARQYPERKIRFLIEEFERTENGGHKLHFHQADAVVMVVNNNFSILTGGPGTGKTTVLKAIAYVLRKLKNETSIVFTAPTGKAARRIKESTGENAVTIHKKLGLGYSSSNPDNFFEDVLFIDESSMLDIDIGHALFQAVKNGRKLVLVGDVDQLPSVGPGAILRDLIRAGLKTKVIPVTMLTHTFRQDNDSTLFTNINNIRNGENKLVSGPDFNPILLSKGNPEEIRKKAMHMICSEYKNAVDKYGIENVVVLMPYRRKGACSNTMNMHLQKMMNKKTQCYRYHSMADNIVIDFKEGDFVMQLENREECANGDVGQVISVSERGVTVKYVDATVSYTASELDQIVLAYAITIHKSQGSEYKACISCLLDEHTAMQQRNLIYTGVTRSKVEHTFIYQEDAFKKAIQTRADEERVSLLVEKMQNMQLQYRLRYGCC